MIIISMYIFFFFFQAEDGIRDLVRSRGLGDVYKRQVSTQSTGFCGGISSHIVFAAHLAMNFVIDVDGDTAVGKWRILMPCTMMEDGVQVSRWILGDYDEAYVRKDGQWLFSRIDFLVNFNVPSLESWAGTETVRGG
eukprot:TRINITY_DN6007_c0_g1_i1.p1 TRINITY_DN6007_c0_g1~~TRINITY_DN6007_c0_g1_i1.p1  ORF type:complete len:137 (-),score=44.66 TRINITY_DN6007_c0_g1_i1:156-566(-)